MSQFEDRLNQIMSSLVLDEEHGDMEEDNTPESQDKDPTVKNKKKPGTVKVDHKKEGIKVKPSSSWRDAHENEEDVAESSHECPAGEFRCPIDKKCVPNK